MGSRVPSPPWAIRAPRVFSLVYATLSVGVVTVAVGGCAHADAVAERQFAEMRETIGKVQEEQDKSSDKDFAEMGAEEAKAPGQAAGAAARAGGPARAAPASGQRTVQLGQDDSDAQSDDPDAPTARPEIRLEGNHVAAPRPSRTKSARSRSDGLDEGSASLGGRGGDGSRPAVFDPEAKQAYEAALAQVDAKRYDRALELLTAFLTRYPDHPYAENATYWRGECYFARGEYLRAAEQFEAVLTRYSGNKAPDALLKMGMAHERLGAADRAKDYWDRLRRDYPRSEAARKIPASSKTEGRGSTSAGPKEDR